MRGGTSASQRRQSDALRGKESEFRMCTLSMPTEVWNTDRRHPQDSYDIEKRQEHVIAISDESTTDPKAENNQLIVNENVEGKLG